MTYLLYSDRKEKRTIPNLHDMIVTSYLPPRSFVPFKGTFNIQVTLIKLQCCNVCTIQYLYEIY